MSSSHLYPDPSDPHPNFMLGEVDLDDAARGSQAALGECLLDASVEPRPLVFARHVHPDAVAAARSNDAGFMFGAISNEPSVLLVDDRLIDLWTTEQT